MSSNKPVSLINNENEANNYNRYQGEFRCAELDWCLLDYALGCERSQHPQIEIGENLLLSCLDQREDFDLDFACRWADERELNLIGSYGPSAKTIRRIE